MLLGSFAVLTHSFTMDLDPCLPVINTTFYKDFISTRIDFCAI
ncbi:hypothetical protein [Gilliamella mensalis]|nr:hypothetical protein [Gilliamella mensalis]